MTEQEKFEVVKQITRALKKEFKGIGAHSYGYCCGSDYDAYHKEVNPDDFIDAKIYKGGNNNQYTRDGWEIGSKVYYTWNLTKFNLNDIVALMNKVAQGVGEVVIPRNEDGTPDESRCLQLVFHKEVN